VSDDGEVYIVAEPEKVEQLDEIIDEKVKVTGSVEGSEGVNIITIASYEVAGNGTVTIIGRINSKYEIVTDDGEAYEIEASEKGEELIGLIGKKVKATGRAAALSQAGF
jgi:hypothetical protein